MGLLWIDFLNSNYHDWRGGSRSEDRLQKNAWLSDFMQKWSLTAEIPPQATDMYSLKEFRSLLFRMAHAITTVGEITNEDLQLLNMYLGSAPVIRQVEQSGPSYQLLITSAEHNWRTVIGEIAASFAQTLTAGDISRIRICNNPDCLWVFYDDTRNRSKRYCDDKLCGNLMKVRRFRARQKEKIAADSNE